MSVLGKKCLLIAHSYWGQNDVVACVWHHHANRNARTIASNLDFHIRNTEVDPNL